MDDDLKITTNPLQKAYENMAFLNSPPARLVRVMCEMLEPEVRFRQHKIKDTIVFFGSARTLSRDEAQKNLENIKSRLDKQVPPSKELLSLFDRAQGNLSMSRYYEEAVSLSQKLASWSLGLSEQHKRFIICSGGGPGIMEAANKGAKMAGGPSIGLNISLPFEQLPNPYQTMEISFDFHYFFIRKFWFFYLAKALIVFPGGFGTLDEFFELLTLVQTKKSKKYMPIILYGTDYWNELINFKAMVKWGMINEEDLNLFKLFNDVDSAFQYLTKELSRLYLDPSASPQPPD